jgi:phage terminase large subunit GpA-like protein
VRGWGEGGESWVVDHQVVPAEPGTNPADWDALLKRLLGATYPLADGSGRQMRIRGAGYDAYGVPGVTEQGYAAWLRRRRAGGIRRLGVVEYRDAWGA